MPITLREYEPLAVGLKDAVITGSRGLLRVLSVLLLVLWSVTSSFEATRTGHVFAAYEVGAQAIHPKLTSLRTLRPAAPNDGATVAHLPDFVPPQRPDGFWVVAWPVRLNGATDTVRFGFQARAPPSSVLSRPI